MARRLALGAIILVFAVLLVFGQVCRFDFVAWDDPINVYNNPFLHPVNLTNIGHFWGASYYELYTPLMYTFWSLCAGIAPPRAPLPGVPNPSASVFHAANLGLHLANTLLFANLLRVLLTRLAVGRRIVADQRTVSVASTAGALLFALHPMQAESVAWVTGANNLLSGFFVLLTLTLYLRARPPGKPADRRLLALATVTYVLALLAKPMAASTALLAVILDWGTQPDGFDRAPWQRWALSLPILWIFLGIGDALITHASSSISHKAFIPYWGRPFVAGSALAFYGKKLLFPLNLCVDYTRAPALILHSWWGYADTAFVGALIYLIGRYGGRIVQTAALVFAVTLLPSLGFIPFYLHLLSSVGDRYIYLALLGPAFAIAYCWAFAPLTPRLRQLYAALYIGLVLFWSEQCFFQTASWSETRTLYEHALTINPTSTNATIALGDALERAGDPDAAAAAFERAIRFSPDVAEGYYDLGAIMVLRGQLDDGIALLRKATALYPEGPAAHRNLGIALEYKGQWPEAIAELETAVRLQPYAVAQADLADARRLFAQSSRPRVRPAPEANPQAARANADGMQLLEGHDLPGALLAFRRAITLRPDFAEPFFHLGETYDQQGETAEAVRSYRSALLRQPHDAAQTYFNLGMEFVRLEKKDEAAREFKAALREKPDWGLAKRGLAALGLTTAP